MPLIIVAAQKQRNRDFN